MHRGHPDLSGSDDRVVAFGSSNSGFAWIGLFVDAVNKVRMASGVFFWGLLFVLSFLFV